MLPYERLKLSIEGNFSESELRVREYAAIADFKKRCPPLSFCLAK